MVHTTAMPAMPSASVRTAAAVEAVARHSPRHAERRSWVRASTIRHRPPSVTEQSTLSRNISPPLVVLQSTPSSKDEQRGRAGCHCGQASHRVRRCSRVEWCPKHAGSFLLLAVWLQGRTLIHLTRPTIWRITCGSHATAQALGPARLATPWKDCVPPPVPQRLFGCVGGGAFGEVCCVLAGVAVLGCGLSRET